MLSFIYLGYAGSLLPRGLFSSFGQRMLLRSCDAQTSHCGGFSGCGAQPSGAAASGLSSWGPQALEHRLSSCGTWASAAPWHVGSLWARDSPVSPALAGRFFTTEPPGKPYTLIKKKKNSNNNSGPGKLSFLSNNIEMCFANVS